MTSTPSPRQKYFYPLAVLALLVAVCAARALPAFHRGTYATEGGEWLGLIWRHGFGHCLLTIREDYAVLGNLCVIGAADLFTRWFGGHPLAGCGPAWQHALALVYVAIQFFFLFWVLQAHHGWRRALGVALLMLLVPDLDDENRIFGEANNVGFFSSLAVAAVIYDAWLRPSAARGRRAIWLFVLVFHLFTSPMAGLVAGAGGAIMLARAWWHAFRKPLNRPQVLRETLYWLVPLVLVAATIWRAAHHGQSASQAAHATNDSSGAFLKCFLDIVVARQMIYPLLLDFYQNAGAALVLRVSAGILAVLAVWIWLECREAKRGAGYQHLTGLLLLAGIAFGQSVLTAWSRPWLLDPGDPYSSVWPARYYLAQNMLMAGFYGLVLLRLGDLVKPLRRPAIVLVTLLPVLFVTRQWPHLVAGSNSADPAVDARRWPHQLGRVRDIHQLTGELPLPPARPAGASPVAAQVEMYIAGHALPVPPEMLATAIPDNPAKRPDVIPCDFTREKAPMAKPGEPGKELRVQSLRVIPRAAGTLVTFDALLPKVRSIARKRRHVWLGNLPGCARGLAYGYVAPEPNPPPSYKASPPNFNHWMFKVLLWFPGSIKLEDIQVRLQDLPVVLGATPDEGFAAGSIPPAEAGLPVSSLRDDETWADVLHPASVLWSWQWATPALTAMTATHLEVLPNALRFPKLDRNAFDEAAYLRQNPDVARAVCSGALRDGRGHFENFGWRENRPFAERSVELKLAPGEVHTGEISGLAVRLTHLRGDFPDRLRCAFRGADGQSASLLVLPAEGRGDFRVSFLPRGWAANDFQVNSLELGFEAAPDTHSLRVESLRFFSR